MLENAQNNQNFLKEQYALANKELNEVLENIYKQSKHQGINEQLIGFIA